MMTLKLRPRKIADETYEHAIVLRTCAATLTACLLTGTGVWAQSEELLVLEYATGIVDTVEGFTYDTVPTFYSTDWSIGAMGNVLPLALVPPTMDLWAGAQFNRLAPAAESMDVLTYPARTAGHLFIYENGVRMRHCSANLVGRRHALVASHCLYRSVSHEWFGDSMSVAPAYDNGVEPLGSVVATRAYIPLRFSNNQAWEDVALVELREPVGDEVGWIGLASTTDDSYFSGKVFHKFSYPGQPDPFDPLIIHNGDTLNYHYGFVEPSVVPNYLSVPGTEAHGVNGESGSSMLYTDNVEYYSFGVESFLSNYKHRRITPNVFQAFAQVIADNSNVGIADVMWDGNTSHAYPNPASDQVTITVTPIPARNAVLEVVDVQGRVVVRTLTTGRETEFEVSALEGGVYLYRLVVEGSAIAVGRVVIE